MMSVGDIARRDGVKPPGVSRRVKQLRANGLQVELDAQGKVKLVNAVQYDELRARFADPSKAQAPAQQPTDLPEPRSETYDEARRQLTWIEAERAKLKLEAEQKLYVRVEDLEAALADAGETIVEIADRLQQSADELAAAVARDGVSGLRAGLKKLAADFKTDIADALAAVANREET